MKIFVGWSYDTHWVKDYAVPLIESYGVEVLTGEELFGEVLTDAVKAKIDEADATVFFTSRREQEAGGRWKTSDWVVDEIKHANSLKKERILEIREDGVEYPNKINAERQYITFKPDDRMGALVKLGKAVSMWRGLIFKLKLLPEEFIKDIRKRLNPKNYRCSYSIRQRGNLIYGPRETGINREGQGLFIYAHELPANALSLPDAFIEVYVDIGDQWSSAGIQLSALEVNLEKT